MPPLPHTHTQPPDCSGERLSAADGLDSAEWEQAAWSGSDEGDELDQLEVRMYRKYSAGPCSELLETASICSLFGSEYCSPLPSPPLTFSSAPLTCC